MISIPRKYFSSLISNPNSFLCNSNVHFFRSIHPFSSSRGKRLITPCPEICDVLVNKHQFSPESASLASSRLPQFRSPKKADSVLSFLKERSFTTAQLEKIVLYNPRILGFTIESIESRLKVFNDLGLSPEEIAKILAQNTRILHSSMKNSMIPSLSMLKGLLGSNHGVATILKKSSWFLSTDLEKTLIPNVEILKSVGIPMEHILHFLYVRPRDFVVKPDTMRRSVDRAIEIGVARDSLLFLSAVSVLACVSEGIWEVKLQILREFGFSDDNIFAMFRKQPMPFSLSQQNLKKAIEFLLATGKYNISSIATCPRSLGCSIEKRLEPRLQILGVLESRSLIKKWPSLSRVSSLTDDQFFDRFIRPNYDEIGEEHIPKIFRRGG